MRIKLDYDNNSLTIELIAESNTDMDLCDIMHRDKFQWVKSHSSSEKRSVTFAKCKDSSVDC